MPQDADLLDLYIELLTSQVAGLYDDETKKMYVVTNTGEIGPAEKITYAHEYTHALQDQQFTLRDVVGRREGPGRPGARADDARRGRRDAAHVALGAAAPHAGRARRGRDGRRPRVARRSSRRCPRSSSETLLFPYTPGPPAHARRVPAGRLRGRGRSCSANPPDSTEQVLHPDKLAAARALASTSPSRRTSPAGLGDGLDDRRSRTPSGSPAERLARGRRGRRRRRPTRPRAGAATAWRGSPDPTARTPRSSTPLGHGRRRRRVRRGADGHAIDGRELPVTTGRRRRATREPAVAILARRDSDADALGLGTTRRLRPVPG